MSREVPEGWDVRPLGNVMDFQNGFAFKPSDWKSTGLPIVRIQNLNGGHEFNYYDGFVPQQFSVVSGDILFCWSGSRGTSFGPRRWHGPVGWLNQHIFRCDLKPGIDLRFAFYVLDHLTISIEQAAHGGAGLVHIKKSELVKFEALLPPLHEQRRIAEILSSVDEAIAATRAVIEQTRRVKQGLLERLLTKGIGHTRFKQTEIGEIPEGWEVASLVDAGVRILDGDRGKEYPKADDYMSDGHCLFLSAKNVTRSGFVFEECQYISEEKHRRLRNGLLQRFDVVVTTRGTIGNFALYGQEIPHERIRVNSGMAILRSIESMIQPDFLFALSASNLMEGQLARRVFGSAQPQLTLDILRRLVVPVPSRHEQLLIAQKATELREVEKTRRIHLAALERLKSSLMSDLLTGRKRVADALRMAAE